MIHLVPNLLNNVAIIIIDLSASSSLPRQGQAAHGDSAQLT